jgi:predicted unusual protein kinase regulating ubiquinone biosynthesis (AarF/ABC1/UbiB family)
MRIIRQELSDIYPRLKVTRDTWIAEQQPGLNLKQKGRSRVEKFVGKDDILNLFEFYNDNRAVASASIGQVYKARIRPGPQLEAAIGKEAADRWGGAVVAIKVQRPDVEQSASLDMYLLRRTAGWLSKVRGGDLPKVVDAFGMQLFGELDYVREANNCDRFRELYGDWNDLRVPAACTSLTRRRVLVMEWVDGVKGPWPGQDGINMVSIGLRCSVDQLMSTGLFHADPHRGNLLKTPDGKLAFIDFGMMADINVEDRYGLFGLVIGLQNKDIALVTENLLKVGTTSSRYILALMTLLLNLICIFLARLSKGHYATESARSPSARSTNEFYRRDGKGFRRQLCKAPGRARQYLARKRVALFDASVLHNHSQKPNDLGRRGSKR